MNKKHLLKRIREEFPGLEWKTATHIVEGADHYVLLLDNTYIFRFPRKENDLKKLYGEVLFLKYLSRKNLSVPVPQYQFIAKDKSFAGYPVLQGVQMTNDIFEKLPKKTKSLIAKQLASFFSILHKIPLTTAKKYEPYFPNNEKQYRELLRNIKTYVNPRMSKRQNMLIDEFLKEFSTYQKFPTKTLIHGDLADPHLILGKDRKKLSGIIDFADKSIGDPAMDFAELWIFGEKFIKEVYQNYTGPKDKNFLHRAQLYCKRVPLLEMIHSSLGMRASFSKGYSLFRQMFYKVYFPKI